MPKDGVWIVVKMQVLTDKKEKWWWKGLVENRCPAPFLGKHHSPEARKRISKSLKEYLKHYPRKHSKDTIRKIRGKALIWAKERQGKNNPNYGKVQHGRGEWFIRKDDKRIFLRSSWELKFARLLDEHGLTWIYEPITLPVIYEFGGKIKQGTYTPDFWVAEWQKYIEIKGYWPNEKKAKFKTFLQQYPGLQIEVVTRPEDCVLLFNQCVFSMRKMPQCPPTLNEGASLQRVG